MQQQQGEKASSTVQCSSGQTGAQSRGGMQLSAKHGAAQWHTADSTAILRLGTREGLKSVGLALAARHSAGARARG